MRARDQRICAARRALGWFLALVALGTMVSAASAGHSGLTLLTPGTSLETVSFSGGSADLSRVFFQTDEPLVPQDTNGGRDVYESVGGTIGLVADASPATTSLRTQSADASHALISSTAPLDPADTDGAFQDIFDVSGGVATLVSAGSTGFGNGPYHTRTDVLVSDDGAHVVFRTTEPLVASDTDGGKIDVYERFAGQTTLVSSGGNGSFDATLTGVSADGGHVFFETNETLAGTDADGGARDVYEYSSGGVTQVSVGGTQFTGASFNGASADGAHVFFTTNEALDPGDTDGLSDIYERFGGQTKFVSVAHTAAANSAALAVGYRGCSSDGAQVFFDANGALDSTDTDGGQSDVYRYTGGTVTLVSGSGGGPYWATFSGMAEDGSHVFFLTDEPLDPADADAYRDVYDYSGGLVSVVSAGANGPEDSFFAGSSPDGARVFFRTTEPIDPADTDGSEDVYERFGGATTLLATDGTGPYPTGFVAVSADGTRVVLETDESLDPADGDALNDLYVTSVPPSETISANVNAGETVSTGASPSATDTIETSVTTPTAGAVTVTETATTATPPTGYGLLGQQVVITAPAGTPETPLVLAFRLDESLLAAAGVDVETVQVFRNGALVPACDTGAPGASPDPCVAQRSSLASYSEITVRTSQASFWTFGAHEPFAVSGFFQPVDNPPTMNTAKAGSAIPVHFSLGGDQGLNVFAAEYPRSTATSCDQGSVDAIEQTVVAGASSLTYDATTGRYTYVWKTLKTWRGCRQLVLRFIDGTYLRANFSFR